VTITGYGQESDRQLTQRAGFEAHLTKPVGSPDARRTSIEPLRDDECANECANDGDARTFYSANCGCL
jgi:CheY-like chemotaxis protein